MIKLSEQLKTLLESRSCEIIPVVELYTRDTIDIASKSAPKSAIARFSDTCFTWENSTGSYDYSAKIKDFPSVKTYLDDKQNEAEIILSNVARGEKSASRFVLDNKIKGLWMVIRLVFPDLPDESWVIWWGKCLRPGKIDNQTVSISATQEIGNYKTKIPFRKYSPTCPLTPGKGECIGNIPLTEHTIAYQNAYHAYGTMMCPDRTYATCLKLGNTERFQGQRLVAVSGQFSYVSQDDTTSNLQKKNKKSNIPNIKTESWSSLNQSDSNEIVAIGFGRYQLAGHPFTWADSGTEVKSLQGFCEGKIGGFDFIKCRNIELTLSSVVEHYGDYGGANSQSPDVLFGGFSGYNSKLAYLEVTTTGSKPENVDNAPLITAVIRGLVIPVPDINGNYTLLDSTDDPVHIVRYLFTENKYGRVPTYRMDDRYNLYTSYLCGKLVEDRSQDESIVLPDNEYDDYGTAYRRYKSTSVYTAYTDMYNHNAIDGTHPDFQEPWVRWYRPFEQPPLLPKQNVLRRRYTINGALQEETSLLDFLQKRLLPCFRGWINYNREGKIEIRTREPADNAYLRSDTNIDDNIIPISNIAKWRSNRSGHLVIGVGTENAEVRKVNKVLYSSGCNNLPIHAITTGGLSAIVTPITGGSKTSQGLGYVDISGTINNESSITLKFNDVPDQYYISYTTDGIEDLPCVTRMMTAHLNANPDFSNYFTAYIADNKPNRIYIRCEAGYLELDRPLEYKHSVGDEVMRVTAVFENCNDLFSDSSASFDNIVVDSFTWNDISTQEDDINAVKANYTSAVNDFHVAQIISRTSWDTIDQEAELNETELDLKFVDNYWQAAYLTKVYAIENIDGNINFTWRSGLSGFMLEMGDVVAIRHDSGDGALRYTPVWISSISYNLNDFTATIEAKLYLSSAWDERVQPIEPYLTTTLNPNFLLETPAALGTSGGIGDASPIRRVCGDNNINWLSDARYSICGDDLI